MSLAIERLIDKISSYELLNNFIPGAVYIGIVERVTHFKLGVTEIYAELVLCYFTGVVIGRIGSLFLEGALYERNSDDSTETNGETVSHSDFTKAEILDKEGKITTLSAINNMYRTFISVSVCLLFTVLLDLIWGVTPDPLFKIVKKRTALVILACVSLIILFVKARKKQTRYLVSRVKTVLKTESKKVFNQ